MFDNLLCTLLLGKLQKVSKSLDSNVDRLNSNVYTPGHKTATVEDINDVYMVITDTLILIEKILHILCGKRL